MLKVYCYIFSALSSLSPPILAQNLPLPEPLPLPPEGPNCFGLRESYFCGASFGQYFISNKTLVNGVLTPDVVAFDRAMNYYFGSPSDVKDLNSKFGCLVGTGWDGVYEPPYRASFTCRSILQDSTTLLCNKNNPVPPLCQETCQRYTRGWETVLRNETACPAPLQEIERKLADILAWCDVSPFNGTTGHCIDGKEDQERTCGFLLPLQFPYLCSFCKFSNDPCCHSKGARECTLESSEENHTVFIWAMAFGCSGGIGLLVGAALFYKRRKIDQAHQFTSSVEHSKPSSSTHRLGSTISSISECICEFPYRPTLPDELAIRPGDSILVLWVFDDGWAVGRNATRGGEGAFPLACVVHKMLDSVHGSTISVLGNAYPQRTSSQRTSNQPKLLSSPNPS